MAHRKKKKTFLAVYLGATSAMRKWEKLSPKVRKEREAAGITAWHAWVAKNRTSIVSMGSPLGGTKRVDRNGIANTSNEALPLG